MIPAFVAMKRIVAASTPTYSCSARSTPPSRPRLSTTPRIGSFAKPPCSGGSARSVVSSPSIIFTGSAESAMSGSVK